MRERACFAGQGLSGEVGPFSAVWTRCALLGEAHARFEYPCPPSVRLAAIQDKTEGEAPAAKKRRTNVDTTKDSLE